MLRKKYFNRTVAIFISFLLLIAMFSPTSIGFLKEKAFADTPKFNGIYIIKSAATGKNLAIDVPGSSTESGKNVQSYEINYSTAQQFRITTDEQGYSTIKNVNSNLYLTAETGKKNKIVQQPQNNSDNQKFKIESDGYIKLKADEGYVFDIKDKSTSNGKVIQTYTPTGNWNQKWQFITIEDSSVKTSKTSTANNKSITYKNYNDRQNVNFNDINEGRSEPINTNLADALYKGAVEKDIDKWASLAYGIFGNCPIKDERDYQITIFDDYGENGWDEDFGRRGMLYNRLSGSYVDNAEYSQGSGIKFGSSLSSASTDLFQQIENTIGQHKVKADELKKVTKLDGLDDTTSRKVIYTNATRCWREGGTYKYHYNGFGIAFYDFQIKLLSAEDDSNTSGAVYPYYSYSPTGEDVWSSTSPDGYFSTSVKNEGTEDVEKSIAVGTSYTNSQTVSSSFEESVNYGGSIGVQVNFGSAIGGNSSNSESAVNVSCEAYYGEEYAKNFTNEETDENAKSADDGTNFIVPPHTGMKSYTTSKTNSLLEMCDTPVAISYKVMLYCCNGELYDDAAAAHYTGTDWYDADSMCISFGDASGSDTYGDANHDLFVRGCTMNDVSYDGVQGNIKTYSRYHGDKCINGINWNKVLKTSAIPGSAWTAKSAFDYLCYNYPMSYDGAEVSYKKVTIDTTLPVAVPLYPIGTIQVNSLEDSNIEVAVGEEINLSSWDLTATDKTGSSAPNTEYYGFDKYNGYWKLVNNRGEEVDASAIAELQTDPITHDTRFVPKDSGEIYVKYFINEEDNEETGAFAYVTDSGVVSKNKDIQSKGVKITITKEDPTKDVAEVNASGVGRVTVNEKANLNTLDGIEASVCNANGKELDVLPDWEAKELESKGIKVEEDGTILCTKTGTFHVCAFINDMRSEWIEIVCENSKGSSKGEDSASASVDDSVAQVQTQDSVQNQTADSSAAATASTPAYPEPATSSVAAAESIDQTATQQNSGELLAIAFGVYEKVQETAQATSSQGSQTQPTVVSKDETNKTVTIVVDGKQVVVTASSLLNKLKQSGISTEEIYSVMMVYDIGKANGKIPADKVAQIETLLNLLMTPQERTQNMNNAYAFGSACGYI